MNLLKQFVHSLVSQKSKLSFLTVKNYKADISQFINWFEKEFKITFDPSKITPQILEQYKKSRNLSSISIERHMSSLRKFSSFLKEKGLVNFNLFAVKPISERTVADPWMLKNFKSFLYDHKKSNLTIKNYINDTKNFFEWLSEVSQVKNTWQISERNLLGKINFSVINEYRERLVSSNFQPRTINRKLSSLRNYIKWCIRQGLISEPRLTRPEYSENQNIRPSANGSDNQTIGLSDSLSIPNVPNENSKFPPVRLLQKNIAGANFLFDNLFILPLAKTIELTQYLFWKLSGKKIFKKDDIARVTNIKKEFYAPLNISMRYFPAHAKFLHYVRHVRPKWYKTYHSYSITHYFHFAILFILTSALGFGVYNGFFADMQKSKSTLGAISSIPPRVLSFQGKLTDSSNNPITVETNILFSLYDDDVASGLTALWKETDSVTPDSNGVFFVLLGKNTPIPDTVFSQNPKLFLGITVGNSPELKPRQQIATVPFASNAETLQGLEPITNSTKASNVVLALDSSGNLSIAGSKAHAFQAVGGNLIISGSILSLTTIPGSNSRVEIVPDGIGKIDLSKPIQNSTNNNNISSAVGSVEFDDSVAILATTSAQAALYINQDSTGPLISASTSGAAKFVVENDGTGTFSGDLAINGGNLISTATTFNLLNSTVTTLSLGGAATSLILGATTGTATIRNANANIQGNVTLGDATTDTLTFTGRVAQDSDLLPITTSGTNDLGSSSLPWDNAYIDNIYSASSGTSGYWQRANGIIAQTNISDDILIGATSTSSALIKLSGTNGNNSWINSGNVGIGITAPSFILDVQVSQASTAAAQIFNTNTGTNADGLILKLGNTSTSAVASTNHFISFETAGIGIVGSVQGNGGKGVTYATSGIADFAEYFRKDKNQIIEYGSVVCLKDNGIVIPCDEKNSKILGIASERPAFLGGENLGDGSITVGLVGQVDTLVSISNGAIKAGDALSASDIPAVAVKATKAGQIVGKALENLDTIDESRVVGFYDPDNKEYRSKASFPDIPIKPNIIKVAKIYALVDISWYDPGAYLAQNGDLVIASTGSNGYSVSNSNSKTLTNIGGFLSVIAGNIRAGIVNASELVTNSLVVTSDSIIVNGQNLRDYIATIINDSGVVKSESAIISPVVKTDHLLANVISPLSSDSLVIRLSSPSSLLIVQNASGSAVATIDGIGKIDASNASISGTLRARNIIANSIEGLDARISALNTTKFMDISSYSAQLAFVEALHAEIGQFNQGLLVFGATSLLDVSVTGQLSIGGSMFIVENSIEALGTDLSLQSLRQGGLSIMGGLVYIDTQGNLKIKGDVSVTGKLAVNIISPLPHSDLVINNASGSGILSINQKGDVIASGSGTFSKLNLSFAEPALAVSPTELIASSSAGGASISPYQNEVTIKNPLLTNKSVIYITPVGTPSAQSPFLMRQIPHGSFTVGVQSPTSKPIPFNWLIVN